MNEQQLAAATARSGYVQIIAGPGTGKTFTLVRRVVELLSRGLQPSRIVVVTFTRAAAREVLDRVNSATNSRTIIVIGTFHSVALRLLRRFGDDKHRRLGLIDEREKLDILRSMDCVRGTDARRVAKEISRVKSCCEQSGLSDPVLSEIFAQYERRLELLDKTDFDGLLLTFKKFLQVNGAVQAAIDAVLVDEFQDTSLLQCDITMLLAQSCGNMTVVGDPDQSIYGFRNADMRNFMKMAGRSDTQKCYLERNYRSEQAILVAATRVIQGSQQRYAGDRKLLATKPRTQAEVQFVQFMSPQEEARAIVTHVRFLLDSGVKPSDICVLSRYTSKFESLEMALLSSGIPSKMVGGKRLAEQREVRLIIDYMRVVVDESNSLAVERTINTPRRGFGEKTLAKARDQDGLLTVARIRRLGLEQAREYTRIIDSARQLVEPVPRADVAAAARQAIAVVDHIASSIFDASTDATKLSSFVAAVGSALQQFQRLYEDIDEIDDRTFLEAFLDQWALGTDTSDIECNDGAESITLSTIHSAKGLEWPVVYMVDVSEEDGPTSMGIKKDTDEDRRLLYVAMTRAKSFLAISSANGKAGFNAMLHLPRNVAKFELCAPDMASLSACLGRELKKSALNSRPRSILSKSKRFDAREPVELPPGFQLASELPQSTTKNKKDTGPIPSRRSTIQRQQQPMKATKDAGRQDAPQSKSLKQPGKTLLSFWRSAPK